MPTYPNDLSVLFVWEIASKLFTQEMVSINLLFDCSIIKHSIMCTKGTRGRVSIDTSDRHSTEISIECGSYAIDMSVECRQIIGPYVDRHMVDTRSCRPAASLSRRLVGRSAVDSRLVLYRRSTDIYQFSTFIPFILIANYCISQSYKPRLADLFCKLRILVFPLYGLARLSTKWQLLFRGDPKSRNGGMAENDPKS